MSLRSHRIAAVAAGATILVGFTSFGAVAARLIDSGDIRNNSIQSVDIKNGEVTKADIAKDAVGGSEVLDGSLQVRDLSDDAQAELKGKDGVTNAIAGAGYNHTWAGDKGVKLNTIIESCPEGQVALGGGFSTWGGSDVNAGGTAYDLGGDNKDIQITVSAPYYEEKYDENKYGGNIRPTEWIVKGYNNGETDQIVRAWVTCVDAQ